MNCVCAKALLSVVIDNGSVCSEQAAGCCAQHNCVVIGTSSPGFSEGVELSTLICDDLLP